MQTNTLNSAILEFSKNSEGQISPLLQEFLSHQYYFYWIVLVSCLLAVITLTLLYKKIYENSEEILEYWLPLLFIFIMPLFGLFFAFITIIEITFTPKIYLLQKAEEIVKR